jgi:S-DNA-T family DNA segregation ATPase FtsK/SpoIIIE
MFEVLPAPGVKLSRIVNLQDHIAMRLAAASVRIVAPIPGKHAVGIEIPNIRRNIVSFRELIVGDFKDRESKNKAEAETGATARAKKLEIPVILGKDITGEAVTIDLATTPHLLIAGSTGSGKSVCVNTMILSILYRCHPAECRLILVDPKIVELNLYNDIPHLLAPVITEPKRALQALQYCICEMERRYSCLDSMHVRDIKSYNNRIKEQRIATEHMPYIVVVIDEFADLMATTGKELETTVARLAAKSRAVGIHLVLATQRPSTDVITGLIKSNVPSRIAFMVASQIDSRIIIDTTGAEKLLGKGDMLYSGIIDPFPVRMQGAFVSEEEVERVVDHVKTLGTPDYIDDEIFFDEEEDRDTEFLDGAEDPLYEKATEIVCQQGRASASYIQRRLKIGYNRAARLVELMESRGIVGPAQGSKPRELLRAV